MSEVIKYPQSTNVVELAYEPATEDASAKLIATFKDGKRYSYTAVPAEVWAQLRDQSVTGHVGALFSRLIRIGGYAYARLDDDLDLEEGSAGGPLEEAPRRRYQRIEQPPARLAPPRSAEEHRKSVAERRRSRH